ncbi:molecular chaperone HtpG [Pelotomaculum sp. PtaB.Bin117]|uniref:molecular chaperone HtpG n=1 Tax=Pelotomaculum sp. PtaB.Bin117 TaxID=1811694 RepID=UPI0009CDF66B|nr:molecular chaperone HtpG [Pelotomaculum sp. PtaB.Bin117]OPX87621.1 MAG: Chaperone protein HtpG [Pelotomaculum sp. PtaB.Bin117]
MSVSTGENTYETREFQAEVKQILDIVVNSLYTDREIFLRELISNAADALEKFRYENLTNKNVKDGELPLEITIELDDKEHTLTITDTGIGMTREELIENLGTIAHSGSKAFIRQMAEANQKDLNLIGQFGVGFYAAFMVAKKIRVLSRSYQPEAAGCEWVSDGIGNYTVGAATDLPRGTKIILELKDDAHEFAGVEVIKRIIKQYSSFVSFTIRVNGEQINTVQAIWTRNKNEIKEEEYNEFYKFIANAYDEPLYRLHFSADAPLAINALLFVPKQNFERYGFSRTEPGVNLYCRKILIQQQAEGILPEWLRFVKGVVDSEDIPLNISRETMQDSTLMSRLRRAVTGRFLRFLNEQAKADPDKYEEFWKQFGFFIKEGVSSDYTHRDELAKLLRFESSKSEPGKLISLADYTQRMKEGQKDIYYINGPTREIIEAGPYLEVFRARDLEVIYTHEPVDDFVLSNLMDYEEKKLVSADQAGLDLPALDEKPDGEQLDHETVQSLTGWMKEILGNKVTEVKESTRLINSPAVILNQDGMMTSSMQRVMQAVNKDLGAIGRKMLEINPRHELIKRLAALREKDEKFARLAAEQIYDNALISAGLMTDPRDMVNRMYDILERALAGDIPPTPE